MICANTLKSPAKLSVIDSIHVSLARGSTYFVKSNPCSSSTSGCSGACSSCFGSTGGGGGGAGAGAGAAFDLCGRVGLLGGDLPTGGGLLLWTGNLPEVLMGLKSYAPMGLRGVLPISAYRQNGAGELVGMCWLGRWAVLGGASLGLMRGGAGVMKEVLSSLG